MLRKYFDFAYAYLCELRFNNENVRYKRTFTHNLPYFTIAFSLTKYKWNG